MTVSDDFSSSTLGSDWTFQGPGGVSFDFDAEGNDSWLELQTPDGNHDIWNANNAARAMQDMADVDFEISAKFLTTPTQRYQMQGLLVEEDASNWIRFDTYSNGSTLYAFAAITVNGSSSVAFQVPIPGGTAPFVRVDRAGDVWTFEYSQDGSTWVEAGSFTHAINVTATGVFAGNSGPATGYTAQVDYFESSLDPLVGEDAALAPPDAQDDAFSTEADTALTLSDADLLANDTDPANDPLTIVAIGSPEHGTLTDNGNGTYTYTPDPGFNGEDTFTYTISDGSTEDTATVVLTVGTPAPPSFNSDDFSGGSLSDDWIIVTPSAATQGLGDSGADQYLTLSTGAGNYDLWGSNNAARAMQVVSDGDFAIEALFLSTPTERFQMQGFLFEADAQNWLRFDTYSNGSGLYAFAAITINGSTSTAFQTAIPGGVAPYLRVEREGDTYTFYYSLDGEAWTVAGSLTSSLVITQAGVFAGSSGANAAYVAEVDYVQTDADPLVNEDGVAPPPDAIDDSFATAEDTAITLTEADLLGNDTLPEGSTISVQSVGSAENGTLTDNGNGTYTYTPDPGFNGPDSFEYTITDGTQQDTATVNLTVGTPPPPSFNADDFSGASLGSEWTVIAPNGTSQGLETSGVEAYLTLTTQPGNHDLWGSNNAVRVMQVVSDDDFGIEARFLSVPTEPYQMQGFLVEGDPQNWIRFDTYSNGTNLYAFAAITVNGSTTMAFQVQIDGGVAPYLRLEREGDTYTFFYSVDGETWTTAGELNSSMVVSQIGLYGGSTGNAPGFTAQVDYVFTDADPLTIEDGIAPPPDATDDAFATAADTAFTFSEDDLLANDLQPEGSTVTVVSIEQPDHGVLTDNLDGTYTYTPDAGYNGYDGLSYTISDGTNTDSANIVLTVGTPPPPAFGSDDFDSPTLGPEWIVVTPNGATQALADDGTDAYLVLTTGPGNHDVWQENNSARAMQAISDEDFALEAHFLSTPTEAYQLQGFLVEADAQNWLRFDTYSDGNRLFAFAAITMNGSTSMAFKVEITEGTAPYLRVEREGDTYTLSYSQDGETWIEAGSLSSSMVVIQAGVFGGSTGGAGGFTALVDYVIADADPLSGEDGVPYPPEAVDDALATAADTSLTFSPDDLLANDVQPGAELTVTSVGAPEHGSLSENPDGTYTYTPDTGYNGYDSFTYTLSDGTTEDTANVIITVGTPPPPRLASDDFNSDTLSFVWDDVLPQGTGYAFTGDEANALLELSTSAGNYDIWGNTLNAPRIMQEISDEDMTLEVRFLSTPTERHQMQGILVQADESNWLRFDFYSDGTRLYVFAAVTIDGTSTTVLKESISTTAQYLRLERVGDTYSFLYSEDGETWVTAGNAVVDMEMTQAGIFAGSVGADAALTALVDYVESSFDPILDEDAGYEPDPAAPIPADDYFNVDPGGSLAFTESELVGNDYDINGDTPTLVSIEDPANGTITDLGGGNYVYTPDPGFEGTEEFTYVVSDGTFESTGNVSVLVATFDAQSDDFSGETLSPVWQFEGIAGEAHIAYDGAEAFLAITSPEGVQVSASDVMTTPRVLQDVENLDFEISAGFLSEPSQQYQEHGLLVIEDEGNWIRFDLAYTGSTLTLIVGDIVNGQTTYPLFDSIGPGLVEELRISRDGDLFIFEYRGGGSDWVEAFTYERVMDVSQVGLFAGSTSFTGTVPGYTAYVDYFENSLDPITDEDGSYVPVNHAPVAVDDNLFVADSVTFDLSDLTANDYDPDVSDTLTLTNLGTPSNGTLFDNGDGTYTYTPGEGFQGVDTISYEISDGEFTSSATLTLDVQDPINVWYGDTQSFGSPGESQVWINILGNVSENVTELTYSLNGGPLQTLSLGPDTRRLQENGDFNIDIAYTDLDGTSADDVVTIYATLDNGQVVTQDVTIEYEAGGDWSPNYSIDWETVTDLQDVVQVVDGEWTFDDNGVRPTQLGYDRLLVLGDQSWDNYELVTTITMHDLQNVDPNGRDGGGFAIGMLWDGHTTDRFVGWQPASGYEPGASIFYTDQVESHSYHVFSEVLGTDNMSLSEGLTYNFVISVEQTGIYDRVYSIKIWEVGTPEPAEWTLQTTETFSLEEAPATGSIYLNAHYFDVTFGDLTVTEITGSDIIQGHDTAEVLIAADTGSAQPGQGELDVFVGAGGADVFVFGDAGGAFYDDGNGATDGVEDYGFIWDFEAGIDQVQLSGSATDYLLTEDHAGLTPGTAIWLVGTGGDADELIGVINGVTGLDLEDGNFAFTDAIV